MEQNKNTMVAIIITGLLFLCLLCNFVRIPNRSVVGFTKKRVRFNDTLEFFEY